ncbi:MAG: PorV/PorQ family protein [Candidatus Marinimicrobia bacterium]|nr:PorV/PorQ family protein [Candidatus Neomarinimicrobiota bacterium]MCF7840020.1 PorV/PorQ family protein [Candidatus Neomarinimicrobiota bacterium]
MMKKLLISVVVMMVGATYLHAQFVENVSKVGTTAGSFLEIGIGSRAMGMGEAYVGMADDVTALYWNPAGLALIPRNQVTFVHTQWLADINFNHIAGAFPLGRSGTLAASLTSLNMGEDKVRTVFYPEGTGEMFTASSVAMSVGFARRFTDRFSFGAAGKYIREQIWHMSASALAVDIGTLFRTQFNDMRIGMSISNFGTSMQLEGRDTQITHDIDESKEGNNSKISAHLDTDEWSLPLLFRVGIAGEVIQSNHQRLTLALDANHPNNYAESVQIGAEYAIREFAFLRIGHKFYLNDKNEDGDPNSPEGFTAGAGVNLLISRNTRFYLDYSYGDFGLLDQVQRFSINLEF